MPQKLDAASFHRNKQPMLEVLRELLGDGSKQVLEIASGSGQHGPFFTSALPGLTWWPSDISDDAIASINAWTSHLNSKSVMAPQKLDVTCDKWRNGEAYDNWPLRFDAVLSMNMIHISPYAATTGLIEGAAKRLVEGGLLIFYGPFKRGGKHTAPSNEAFDQSLKARNGAWGIRDLEEVSSIAGANKLQLQQIVNMPANNFVIVFTRQL